MMKNKIRKKKLIQNCVREEIKKINEEIYDHDRLTKKNRRQEKGKETASRRAAERVRKTRREERGGTQLSTDGAKDHFRVPRLEDAADLAPSCANHLAPLRSRQGVAIAADKGGGFLAGPAIAFKDHRHQLPPGGWVATSLLIDLVHCCQTIFVGSGLLARLVSGVFASNRPINKDGAAVNRIAGGTVEPGKFRFPCSRVEPVPSRDTLLSGGSVSSNFFVVVTVPVS
jgi:hypothetical protein